MMIFYVDPHSEIPIYVQIINQVKHAAASGIIQPGDRLPSVRRLARELVVNPNTIARAYQELERDGVITTQQGRGTFVAEKGSILSYEERLKQLGRLVRRLLVEAYHLDVSFSDLLGLVEREMQEFAPEQAGEE